MFRKNFRLFLPIFVLLLAALACGGSDPVIIADIPAFTDSVKVESGQNTMVDTVVKALKETAGQEGVTTEYQVYGVPAGTTWDAVKSFYTSQFGSDWTEDSQLTANETGFDTSGWTRGGGLASEQAVVVALVEDPLAGQSFLIVILFSE